MFTVTFQPSFCLLKAWSSVGSVISVIVMKTVFVLMLNYVGQKYSPENKYFFSSFDNDRELSLEDKNKRA